MTTSLNLDFNNTNLFAAVDDDQDLDIDVAPANPLEVEIQGAFHQYVHPQETFVHPKKARTPEYRALTGDRHQIPDPTTSIENAKIWLQTVISERVGSLFLTSEGLPGHVRAIQNELNRINHKKIEGLTGDHTSLIYTGIAEIQDAVKKAARRSPSPIPKDANPNDLIIKHPLIENNDVFLKKYVRENAY